MTRLSRIVALNGWLLMAATPALAQTSDDHGMWWGWGHGWGYGHMMVGGLAMMVFWGIVVVLGVLAIRQFSSDGPRQETPPRQSPLDILKERYARGEIDEAELEERKKVLNRH
jgi:putative membrane protein